MSSSTIPSIQHEETLFDASFVLRQCISKTGLRMMKILVVN